MKKLCARIAAAVVLLAPATKADAGLIHLWDFEAGAELADSVGGLDLNYAPGNGDVGGVMGTAADVTFESGYGGVGQAYRPYYVDPSQSHRAGAGLTGTGFTNPTRFTIEAIVNADAKTTQPIFLNYLFTTRPASDRGYFLVQDGGAAPGSVAALGTVIGQNFTDRAIATEYETDGTWIYIAAAIDLSPIGQAFADIYVANLSAGETTPTLVVNDRQWTTNDTLEGETGIFGVGSFPINLLGADDIAEASQEWFQGSIDYVAIYDELLGEDRLGQNLIQRLSVPEPGTVAMVILGGLMARRFRVRG